MPNADRANPAKRTFNCSEPKCDRKVVYDPDDPMHHTTGALLRKASPSAAMVVYLTCAAGHMHRYTFDAKDG